MTTKTTVIKHGTIKCSAVNPVFGAYPTEDDKADFLAAVETGYKAVPGNESAVVNATFGGWDWITKTQSAEGAPIFAGATANLEVLSD